MTVYVGMTQDLEATQQYFIKQKSGMYPDVIMGPFKKKIHATNYIKFMQNKFPDAIEINQPYLPDTYQRSNKWWVFSFEHSGQVH